jgi:hypothetical protein
MKINAKWHGVNKMPKNPSLDQRISWHLAHAKNCACRPLGGKILKEIKKEGVENKRLILW